MLDLVPAPARTVRPQQQAVRPSLPNAQDEWTCTIAPNPPAAVLLVERRGAAPVHDVEVLLDGEPARDHPTVYLDATAPGAVSLGSELEYHLVLPGSKPQFDTLEVRWTDDGGQRRSCTCDVANHASGPQA